MKNKILVLIFALIFSNTLFVYSENKLIWEDCVEGALRDNPQLARAREILNQSRASKLIVESGLLPQITTQASGKRSDTGSGKPGNSYTYGLSGEQLVFDGFKIASDVSAAIREINAAQYNYDVISSNVRLNLKIAFVELLRARALLMVTENISQRRRQNLELVTLLYNAGREHKGSFAIAKADLAQAELEITEARRNIELSQRRLLKELGLPVFIPIEIQGTLEEKSENREKPEFELLAETTPFLNELVFKKEAARFEVKSAKANYIFPKVYADASIGKTDDRILPAENEWSFGLRFSYPLYEGGSRTAEIKKSKARLGETEADERGGRDEVVYTLQETWTGWQNAIDNVGVRREFLGASELRAEITRAEYSNGLALFDNWAIIEDELSRNKKAYLNSLADTLIEKAYWIQAKGGTLENAE